jgi:hypothetical protein
MYYVLNCIGDTDLSETPNLPGGPWMHGQRLTIAVPEPLLYTLDPDYPGDLMAMYKDAIPLMRDDLLQALQDAGVDNLETFRAILRDPANGVERTDYKAVNVVGLVSCADATASKTMDGSPVRSLDTDFDSLVIDEKRVGGALLFRLAEAVNAIVVHDKVKQVVEARGIPGIVFLGPGEWAG